VASCCVCGDVSSCFGATELVGWLGPIKYAPVNMKSVTQINN
jgi:hypothetical protein